MPTLTTLLTSHAHNASHRRHFAPIVRRFNVPPILGKLKFAKIVILRAIQAANKGVLDSKDHIRKASCQDIALRMPFFISSYSLILVAQL